MTDIRLISKSNREIKPLVESALANELRLLEAGIERTEQKIKEFENKYQITTQAFLDKYENDFFEETMDFDEWIGESRMLARLREKAATLRDIHFAN